MPFRLLVLLVIAPVAAAQPFDSLEVGVSGLTTFGGAPYTDFWDPGPGVEVRAATPFYVGEVALGVAVSQQRARAGADVPGYLALYPYASWGYAVALPGGVRLTPGLRAGLYAMWFDVDDVSSVRREAELAAGAEVRLSVPVGRGWRVNASGAALRLYTAERIELGVVHLGLSRAFATPRGLGDFLR